VDAVNSQRAMRADEGVDADDEIVWSWRPGAGAKGGWLDESFDRRGQSSRSPGRARI